MVRGSRWAVVVWVIACDPGSGSDGGIPDGGGHDPLCTLTVAEWRDRCADEPASDDIEAWCAELSGQVTPADVATLALNIAASEIGALPVGLGEMRFTHPMRSHRTLREHLSRFHDASPSEREALAELAFDANRAFEGCVDHGVLKPTVVRQLCSPDGVTGPIIGPEGFACHALDNECSRGVLRSEGCCDVRPRPNGMLCGMAGQCVGGQCLPLGTLPDPPDYTPVAVDGHPGVVGTEHWIDGSNILPGRSTTPWFEWIDPTTIRIHDDTTPIADLSIDDGLSLESVRVVSPREDGAVGVLASSSTRALFVDLGGRAEVCVVAGDRADPRVAWSDCVGRGVVVPCPSAGLFTCEVAEGRARITGPELLVAWPLELRPPGDDTPPDDAPGDPLPPSPLPPDVPTPIPGELPPGATPIHDDVFTRLGICIEVPGLGCIGPSLVEEPECQLGSIRACQLPCGAFSVQVCNLFGWGNCIRNPFAGGTMEECNAIDDDCDGMIDEDFDCDDGLSCTEDRCRLTGPFAAECWNPNTRSCRDTALCTEHLCQRTPPPPTPGFPGRSVSPSPSNPLCHIVSDHIACQNGCDCDGAEVCSPAADPDQALPGVFFDGCVGPPPPCDLDNSRCTVEACIPVESQREACGVAGVPFGGLTRFIARRRGLTNMQPWDPADPTRQVECVDPVTVRFAGRERDLFFEVECNDGNECTLDACRASDAQCIFANLPVGSACSLPPPPGLVSAEVCGVDQCDGDGACELVPPDDGIAFECDEVRVDGPDVFPGLRQGWVRLPFDQLGDPIRYEYTWETVGRFGRRQHRREIASCHIANSCVTGICTVRADQVPGVQSPSCPPAAGCLVNECASPPLTTVATGTVNTRFNDMVIGCRTIRDDEQCRGSLPLNNECLVPSCNADGSCDGTPDDGFCIREYDWVVCEPDGAPVPRFCLPATGRCEDPCVF